MNDPICSLRACAIPPDIPRSAYHLTAKLPGGKGTALPIRGHLRHKDFLRLRVKPPLHILSKPQRLCYGLRLASVMGGACANRWNCRLTARVLASLPEDPIQAHAFP